MDADTIDRIAKLEKQMAAMIDRYNMQDDRIERLGYDVAFIHAYINEQRSRKLDNPVQEKGE